MIVIYVYNYKHTLSFGFRIVIFRQQRDMYTTMYIIICFFDNALYHPIVDNSSKNREFTQKIGSVWLANQQTSSDRHKYNYCCAHKITFMTTALDDKKNWFAFSEIEFKSEVDSRCTCRIFNVLLLSLNVADIDELKFLAVMF